MLVPVTSRTILHHKYFLEICFALFMSKHPPCHCSSLNNLCFTRGLVNSLWRLGQSCDKDICFEDLWITCYLMQHGSQCSYSQHLLHICCWFDPGCSFKARLPSPPCNRCSKCGDMKTVNYVASNKRWFRNLRNKYPYHNFALVFIYFKEKKYQLEPSIDLRPLGFISRGPEWSQHIRSLDRIVSTHAQCLLPPYSSQRWFNRLIILDT